MKAAGKTACYTTGKELVRQKAIQQVDIAGCLTGSSPCTILGIPGKTVGSRQ